MPLPAHGSGDSETTPATDSGLPAAELAAVEAAAAPSGVPAEARVYAGNGGSPFSAPIPLTDSVLSATDMAVVEAAVAPPCVVAPPLWVIAS